MIKINICKIFFQFSIITFLLFTYGMTMDLDIHIKNIKNQKGQLFIALYNTPSAFPSNQGQALRTTKITLKDPYPHRQNKDDLTHTFKNISPGTYAIACYHDENNNDKLDTLLNEENQQSFLLILDAQSFEEQAIASLPSPLPFGLHGLFVAS